MGFQGKKIEYSYFYANVNTPWTGDTYGGVLIPQATLNVGDGVELGAAASLYTIDVSDTQIRFDFNDTGIFSGAAFNGARFMDTSNSLNPISGFKLIARDLHGLDMRDIVIAADGNSILINFQEVSFSRSSSLILTVEFELINFSGKKGNDLLRGAMSDDLMIGAKGADRLYGDAGRDVFMFRTGDSGNTRATADTIFDFNRRQGDQIDLSRWDADSNTRGIQDFDFIGKSAFSKEAGELRYETLRGDTHLYGDTDGDGKADFLIRLDPATNLRAGDFLF